MFMHPFYIIVTVFSIQFSILCFPLTIMHLQLAGFHSVKNFPGRAVIAALHGSIWIVLLWEGPVQTLYGRNRSKGRHLVFPGARSRQRSPWEISEHVLCPIQSLFLPQGWLQWRSSYLCSLLLSPSILENWTRTVPLTLGFWTMIDC